MRSRLSIAHCSTLQLTKERKQNSFGLVWFRKGVLKPGIRMHLHGVALNPSAQVSPVNACFDRHVSMPCGLTVLFRQIQFLFKGDATASSHASPQLREQELIGSSWFFVSLPRKHPKTVYLCWILFEMQSSLCAHRRCANFAAHKKSPWGNG